MNEFQKVTDEEREEIIEIVKRIMFMNRKAANLDLLNDVKEEAKFIREQLKEWHSLREDLHKTVDNNIKGWQKELDEKKTF